MCFEKAKSLEGLKGNEILRQKSINSYYKNPNYCLNCGELIKIKKGHKAYQTKVKKYCTRSCAISSNNIGIRRHGDGSRECSNCTNIVSRGCKTGLCRTCLDEQKWGKPLSELTLKDVSYKNHHRAAIFAYVRYRARSWMIKNRPIYCEYCGYDHHVECSHVKAINTFSEDTLINDINHPDNLLWLCPNHHWELEFGKIITLEDICKSEYYHRNTGV